MASSTTTERIQAPAIDVGQYSHQGGREYNEDTAAIVRTSQGVILALADGMGGGEIGRTMSQQAAQALCESLREPGSGSPQSRLEQAFLLANQILLNLIRINPGRFARSGSTMICALIEYQRGEAIAHVANIGDSRAYLLDASGRLRQISRDHTYYQALRDRGVPEAEARQDQASRKLTFSLGTELDIYRVPHFYQRVPLARGATLMLCSDGVSNAVSEEDMKEILGRGSAEQAARRLVERALRHQTTDNATAIVAHIGRSANRQWAKLLLIGAVVCLALALLIAGGQFIANAGRAGIPADPAAPTDVAQATPSPGNAGGSQNDLDMPTSTRAPTLTPSATATATPIPTNTPIPTRPPIFPTRQPPRPPASPTIPRPPTVAPPAPVPTQQPATAFPTSTEAPAGTALPTATVIATAPPMPSATPIPPGGTIAPDERATAPPPPAPPTSPPAPPTPPPAPPTSPPAPPTPPPAPPTSPPAPPTSPPAPPTPPPAPPTPPPAPPTSPPAPPTPPPAPPTSPPAPPTPPPNDSTPGTGGD